MGSVTALRAPNPEPEDSGRKRLKPRRNVNGEGNIRQRSDGRWEGRAYVITTDGREIRRSVYGRSWDDVHEKLTKLQADRMVGKRVATSKLTVAEYLEFWLDEYAAGRVRPSTLKSYRWIVANYLTPYLGRKKAVALRPADIRKALIRLKNTCQCCERGKDREREQRAQEKRALRAGRRPRKDARPIQGARCCALQPPVCCRDTVSDGTIRYAHRLLRAALQDAVTEEELITVNVAKGLRIDHRYRPKFKSWSETEASRFLESIRDHRMYAFYAVTLMLGLRRGEALGLRWSDVDLDNRRLQVEVALQRFDGELALRPVKTDRSVRPLPVPDPLVAVLRRRRMQQDEDQRAYSGVGPWNPLGLVFTTKLGTPIEPRNVNREFDLLTEAAGVPRIRVHDLRHSCASLLWSRGVPLEQIQDILGHADPRTTKTIYVDVDVAGRLQHDAVDRLGFLFGDQDEYGRE
jgi:integrase